MEIAFILYKIYYKVEIDNSECLVYLGRTKQPLQSRIRGHLFKKPMHRSIDIHQVSHIEYTEFQTEADMNLYEIYFINLYKPLLNVDDKCKDELTVTLPDVKWNLFTTKLWNKWIDEIDNTDKNYSSMRQEYNEIVEQKRILRSSYRMNEISEEEYYNQLDTLTEREKYLHSKLYKY